MLECHNFISINGKFNMPEILKIRKTLNTTDENVNKDIVV